MMVQFGIDFLLNSFPTRRGLCGCDCTCMMFYSHQQWGVLYTTICLIPVVVSFVISHLKLDLNSQYTELVRYTLKWSGTTHRELYIHFVCLLSSIRFQLALITQKVVLVQVLHNMLYTNKKNPRNSAI
jgi:hypothetical protein